MKQYLYSALLGIVVVALMASFVFGDVNAYFSFFSEPWLLFTIFDFYVLILLFIIWLFHLEKSWFKRILFSLLFIITGAFGVLVFIIYRLSSKKKLF